MSEYYCSHKPPCCPRVDLLKEQLAAAHESRDAYKMEVDRLSKADDILMFTEERDQLKKEVEEQARLLGISGSKEAALLSRVEMLKEHLRTIEALHGTGHYIEGEPGHENHGCVASDIAKEALQSDGEGK